MRSIITFQEYRDRLQVKGICKACGKKRTRTITETMTMNPFNKNPDGTVRSGRDISLAIAEKIGKMETSLKKNFMCATCRGNLPWKEMCDQP